MSDSCLTLNSFAILSEQGLSLFYYDDCEKNRTKNVDSRKIEPDSIKSHRRKSKDQCCMQKNMDLKQQDLPGKRGSSMRVVQAIKACRG